MMFGRKPEPPQLMAVLPPKDCPAKTWTRDDGTIALGRSVSEHCLIVGEVAKSLIGRFPPHLASHLFPAGAPLVAAAHDVGKISPSFVEKLRRACTVESNLPTQPVSPDLEQSWGGHAGVSQLAAQASNLPQLVPEVLGQHHGYSPPVASYHANDEAFGGPDWQAQRDALFVELSSQLDMTWPALRDDAQARTLAGLTSVADWIGSGRHFDDPHQAWRPMIEPAIQEAGWISPQYRQSLDFHEVFGFKPRTAQRQLYETVSGPGVYVLEAPMGIGKTEAALYAAYLQLQRGQATGIYFALPTQLTSNKIHDRFNAFLSSILAKDCLHRGLLLHAGAWLVDTAMGEEGQPGRSWFNQSKRGLLAPFAVGTLDQALMATMNVKHGFVRAFGLTGKVVILDEVHSYDAYTSTLLDSLIALLRQLHCTVIILSATLNQSRRQQLLASTCQSSHYPLITAAPNQAPLTEHTVSYTDSQSVKLKHVSSDEAAIEEALLRAEQGQQVLWIENTVAEAQQRYLQLAARADAMGLPCGLLHSRYTPTDRQAHESKWVNLYGKSGWLQRPNTGRLLVGTQVLEQSIDIDADFLVSRFAPSDMLLQRLGRLWRHAETPRPSAARCECWLITPEPNEAINNPHNAFGPTASVYSPYILCRSLLVWRPLESISLPEQIRPIIDCTYVEQLETGALARWQHEQEHGTSRRKGTIALSQLARVGLAQGGKTLPESQAQTRYSEQETQEVLLLRALQPFDEGGCRLTLANGTQIQLPSKKEHHRLAKAQWRRLSVEITKSIITVPVQDAPAPIEHHQLANLGLGHVVYLGNPLYDEPLLRVAIVDDDSSLQGLYGAPVHDRASLEYRSDLGYRVIKENRT